jgi:hypothetical protein
MVQINTDMSNYSNRLYLYEDYIDLAITTTSLEVDNRPMNNRIIKAHKGVTNEIFFNIRNRDRKMQNVFSDTLRAFIINPTTKTRILSRVLEHTSDVGKVKLVISEGDIANLQSGLYQIYITRSQDEIQDRPVFTDQNSNIRFDLEISDQIGLQPIATQEDATFLQTGNTVLGDAANTFVSSALSGNQDRNFAEARHTLAVYPNSYTGQVTIQGSCLSATPDSDDDSQDWFNILNMDISSSSNIHHKSFQVNANWIRIVSKPTSGTLSKVILRN